MANKETARMIKLGEWLESYLNPEIKAREYRELAKNFIRLYDVDFKLKENDLTIKFFELLEKQPNEIKRFYQDPDGIQHELDEKYGELSKEAWERGPMKLIDRGEDPLKMKPFLEKLILDIQKLPFSVSLNRALNEDQLIKGDMRLIGQLVYETVGILNLWEDKEYVVGLLAAVDYEQDKWEKVLFKVDDPVFIENNPDAPFPDVSEVLTELGDSYSKLGEDLSFNSSTEEVSVKKKFIGRDQKYYFELFDHTSVFRWDIALARVFLDFLSLGGQDHIHFCKQCGRFTVIQRKGRKEYCSSLCRVRASNERIAQAGA